jgi:hypothetical protein
MSEQRGQSRPALLTLSGRFVPRADLRLESIVAKKRRAVPPAGGRCVSLQYRHSRGKTRAQLSVGGAEPR